MGTRRGKKVNFWKKITRNQFIAQPQRDKLASSIHKSYFAKTLTDYQVRYHSG